MLPLGKELVGFCAEGRQVADCRPGWFIAQQDALSIA